MQSLQTTAILSNYSHNLCQHCIAKPVCFARKAGEIDYRRYSHKVFKRKDYLVRAGEPLTGVYALRSGAAKSFMATEGCHEQIMHFHFPGELLGADGFDHKIYASDIQFLDTSSVCFFSVHQLEVLMNESPEIRNDLVKAMSKEIGIDHKNIMSLSQLSSSQRLARFILILSQTFADRGLSANIIELPMTRTDIANHLGMAIETVSRLFKRFERDGAIELSRRHLEITNIEQLQTYLLQLSEQSSTE